MTCSQSGEGISVIVLLVVLPEGECQDLLILEYFYNSVFKFDGLIT